MLLDVTFSNQLILLSKVRLMASFNTSKIWCPFFIIIYPHTKHCRSIASTGKSVEVIFIFSEEKRGKIVKTKHPCHFSKKITHPVILTYCSDISIFFQVQFFFFTHLGRLLRYKSALKFARALIISKYFHDMRRSF